MACGKTAFVAESSQLQSEFVFLSRNYWWIKFYKSRDMLEGPYPYGGFFTKPFSSKVPFYYQLLFEAGIVGRLKEEKENQRNLGRKRAKQYNTRDFSNKMTMKGCIVTLFMLCATLAGLGGLVFGHELRRTILNYACKIKKACVTFFQKLTFLRMCNIFKTFLTKM